MLHSVNSKPCTPHIKGNTPYLDWHILIVVSLRLCHRHQNSVAILTDVSRSYSLHIEKTQSAANIYWYVAFWSTGSSPIASHLARAVAQSKKTCNSSSTISTHMGQLNLHSTCRCNNRWRVGRHPRRKRQSKWHAFMRENFSNIIPISCHVKPITSHNIIYCIIVIILNIIVLIHFFFPCTLNYIHKSSQ
jgi:hypothetical protein